MGGINVESYRGSAFEEDFRLLHAQTRAHTRTCMYVYIYILSALLNHEDNII